MFVSKIFLETLLFFVESQNPLRLQAFYGAELDINSLGFTSVEMFILKLKDRNQLNMEWEHLGNRVKFAHVLKISVHCETNFFLGTGKLFVCDVNCRQSVSPTKTAPQHSTDWDDWGDPVKAQPKATVIPPNFLLIIPDM